MLVSVNITTDFSHLNKKKVNKRASQQVQKKLVYEIKYERCYEKKVQNLKQVKKVIGNLNKIHAYLYCTDAQEFEKIFNKF